MISRTSPHLSKTYQSANRWKTLKLSNLIVLLLHLPSLPHNRSVNKSKIFHFILLHIHCFQLSIVASTPKDISDVDGQKIQELKSKRYVFNIKDKLVKILTICCSRAELISSLQSEERERQWHYTQLELISQKIRNIPLTSAQSVSTFYVY